MWPLSRAMLLLLLLRVRSLVPVLLLLLLRWWSANNGSSVSVVRWRRRGRVVVLALSLGLGNGWVKTWVSEESSHFLLVDFISRMTKWLLNHYYHVYQPLRPSFIHGVELCDHLITALAMMHQARLEKISFYGTTITANIFHRAEIFAVPKMCPSLLLSNLKLTTKQRLRFST